MAVADLVEHAVRGAKRRRVRHALAACGPSVTFESILAMEYPERIHVGTGTYFGHDLVIKAIDGYDGTIRIGEGCVIVNYVQLLAAYGIEVGRGVTIGRRVPSSVTTTGCGRAAACSTSPFTERQSASAITAGLAGVLLSCPVSNSEKDASSERTRW